MRKKEKLMIWSLKINVEIYKVTLPGNWNADPKMGQAQGLGTAKDTLKTKIWRC